MEALVAYLKRICPLLLGGTDGGDDRFEIAIANNSEVLENFVLESHSALYVQLSEAKSLEEDSKPELCYTISTNVLRGAGNATAMGFLKRKSGPLQERKAIQHQLRVIELGGNLSHFQEVDESGNSSEEEKDREEGKNHAGDNQSFEMLYGYVHHTFTPLLRSYALEMRNENDEVGGGGDASGSSGLKQSLPMLGKKLQELEYALKTCMQQTEIPEVVFNLEPEIVECVGKEEKEGHLGMEELGLESIQDDSTLLKRLKKGVNKWYEDSKQLSTLSRDASSGTALEEVRFWTNMEQALHDVDLQMKGKGVEMTLRILKHYKQFGVILAFQQDTGLTQKFSEVNSYMALIRDFPINAILTASNVKQVQQAVAAVFSHMRKMKTAQYPVKRSFQLLESVSRDLCKKLVTLLKPLRMMKLPYEIFVKENDHCSNLFKTWDEHCGGFRELAREIAKKRGAEKTSARLVVAHAKLRDRLEDVYHCRQNHEKLRHVIVTVLKPLERKNVSDSPSRGPNANNSQRENSAVMDVHDAYKFLSSADVFDVTQEGDEAWESAKKQYELRIDKVETDITATLTDLLASAKTGDEKFRVFSKFNALFFRQRIRGAIQQHQTDLIQTVKDDINALQQKFKRHYSASETERMSGLRDLPPMSAKIIWAKQIERQLDLYIQRVEAVLGSGWETHADGRLLKSTCDGFKRKLDTQPIFNDWLERIKVSSNLEVGGRIFDVIKLSSGGSSKNLELCVSFNKEIITLFKEVRNLSWLATDHYGFRVPYTVKIMSDEAKERYPYAMALTETLRTYKQISKRMSADIVVLTAKIKKSVQVTLAKAFNKHIKWDSESLEEYVKDLSKQIYALQDQVSDLLVKDKAIQSQLTALDQCPFGHDDFGTVLAKIQEYIDEMNLAEYSNLASWTESLDKKVEKILLSRLEIAIEGWVLSYKEENNRLRTASQDSNDDLNAPAQDARSQSITSQMKIFKEQKAFIELEIILRNRILQVSPALEVGRSEWMAQFQNVLRAVVSQRRIKSNIYDDAFRSTSDRRNELDAVERTKKNIYYSLLQRVNKNLFHQVYEIIELSMASLREYVNVWLRYQALWDLHPEQVVEKMGDSIEKWHQVLVEMKEARSTFDNSETEKVIGSLVINYQSVQSKVGDKYDAWHQDMLSRFGRILGKKMSEFHKKLLSSRTQLEQKSLDADTKEVVSFVTMVRGVQRDFDDLERELNMFRASQKLLAAQRFRFPEDWLYIDNIEGEWDAFQQILSRKVEVMDSQVPQLQKRILDEDRRIETRIKDTETDWKNERNERLLVSTDPSEALRTLGSFDLRLKALQEDYQNIRSAIEALGLDSPRDVRVEPMVAELKGFKEVWSALGDIWGEVDVVKEMQWTAFVPRKCRSSLDAIKKKMDIMPGRIQQYEAYRHLYTMITNYKSVCLLLTEVKSDAVKDRHWKLIIKILTLDVASPNRLVLGQLLDSPLKKKETAIKDIIRTAQGEMALEEFLKELKEYWSTNQLELVNYQNKCRLVKGWDDLFSKLDDNLSALSSMKQSPYYKVFQDEAKSWEEKLEKVRLIFDVWIDVQRRWVYLEGIFYGSADIKLQLPNEYTRFRSIDLEFVKLTQEVSRKPEVLDVVAIPNLQRQLDHLLKLLNNVQKALGEYLERQRASFPRFYFCGDEDLLEIIGNGKEPVKILKHIGKMFAGITTLQLDGDDKRTVSGMLSKEGELVGMKNPIVIQAKTIVNDYLRSVEEAMRFTLASLLDESFGYLGEKEETVEMEKYMEWVHKFPAQIIILSAQVQWSISVEKSISSLGACLKRIEFVLEKLSEKVLGNVKSDRRKKYEQLITELVHQRDTTRALNKGNAKDTEEFQWLAQLRYYYFANEENILRRLNVRCANSTFFYGFEYLGVGERLVQTPLTDRCYLTLTQALSYRLGGNPFGPAGTGKTESVKALGAQLGRFVLVFNCDESFDFQAMGRIFVGLCQVGAWGCFDEFNRLEERMLSAVSQQILAIQTGLQEHARDIQLLGRSVSLHQDVGIFVTMNPGYAGRSNLPDNLKLLFRGCAMMKPDFTLIAEVIMFSQGFKQAESIASKVVLLFDLCLDQLSKQPHYDFGLRALKSVLVSAGDLKREQLDSDEVNVMIQSALETVIPKLIAEDIKVFKSLLEGVFPGASLEAFQNQSLTAKLEELCAAKNLENSPLWITKILQLYQVQNMRHGVMMVGPTGVGKSSAWAVLLEAMTAMDGIKGESYVIDAKALNSKDELYGSLDQTTYEWSDGVFTSILRAILSNVRGESSKRHWIVFDGDVDPEWAENLNSVLDDNKILTLPNGERLPIPSNVRIMFETETLRYATLATVSRCGMVWFSEGTVNASMMIKKYVRSSSLDLDFMKDCFEDGGIIEILLEHSMEMVHVMEPTRIRLLHSMMVLLSHGQDLVQEYNDTHVDFPMEIEHRNNFLQKWLLFAMLWGFGGSLNQESRTKFAQEAALRWHGNLPTLKEEETLLDYEVNIEDGEWRPWKSSVPLMDIESHKVLSTDVVIPTVDTVRHVQVLQSWLSKHVPLILCGPPGSGKTMTLTSVLQAMPDLMLAALNFSSGTTPDLILKTFHQYCDYRSTRDGVVLSPTAPGKWLVIFCDEINLPVNDVYGTQRVITFLRQLTERKGFWREKTNDWVSLQRIQFVGACNPPTDPGRVTMSNRWLRHAPLVFVDFPSPMSLGQIYGTFSRALLKLQPNLRSYSAPLTEAMVETYVENRAYFKPSAQPHYIYSPRELSRWVRALYEAIKENADMVLEDLVRIWLHEGLRLFADRLTTAEEQEWCSKKLDQIAMSHFPGADPECIARPILYSNWLSKRYQEVEADPLRQHVEARLRTFYEEELDVKLVVFDEVLDHVLRIDRVLRQPLGHLLLVGESGAGKTVLSKFCAWMNGLSIFQIKLTRKYSIEDFDVDLRNIMKRAGCEDEKICFIFDESNVLDSAFLEHMNALLASGEVPGLFEDDELSALMQEMRARTSSMVDSDEELFRLFTKNVQNNLHIVFTMNPAGGDFKSRSATSPALFNRCVVDWFGNWSVTALEHVGRELTKFVDVGDNDEAVVKSLVKFHEIVREEKTKIVSPRDFLDFISHMISIYEEKRSELEEEQRHLAIGLGKLNETAENVAKLKTGLAAKESELAKKNAQANETLQQMVKDQNEAERRKTESLKLKAELDERNKVVEERRVEAESDLAKAEPALLEAQEAVRSIKRRHLDEMKAMGNPPPAVKITLEAVICLVSGESDPKKEIPWGTIRGYLRGGSFISSVVDFQSETLMTETRELVENKFLKRDGFNFEKVSRANKACGPLYKWLRSQIEYAAIANRVAPLKMEVQKLAEENMELTKRDEELSAEISTLESSIATYKAEYAQLIKESEKIKGEMESVKSKCDRAETLLKSLSEEQDRWEDGSTTFQTQMSTLVGDVLLASAFCVYSGFFDHRKRTNLMQFWGDQLEDSGIAVKENIELTEYLSKGSERLTWKANGLPDDSLSVENGIILQRFDRYPLIIDPSGQASEFLLRQNSDRKIKTTSFLDAAFMKQLESALRFGTALMVQDVENIDPVLNPVLNREFQKTGGRTLVRLGDQEIDFSPSFLMYMTTRDPFFKFSPDVSSRVTFVNFTVTPASLESQCLGKVLKAERPDIDKQRSDLLKMQGEYQARLRELESILLQKIASVEGTILDDDKVISALEILKTEAREIGEKSANAAEVMTSVNEVSSFYQPVANACSTLYFSIEALGKIHHLYQFSLMFFLGGLDSVLAVRGHENLMLEILKKTYSNTSRGMLSEDKLTLAVRVAQIVSNPDEDLFDLLLNSGAAPTEDCEDKLFLEMMTARRDCPHELPKAAEAWVEQVMGENIVRGKEFDLATVVETESSAKTPLLLCSLPGYDASGKVLEIAKNKKIKSLSMGSGDGFALAEKYVLTAAKDGSWVLLRNIHLCPKFVVRLEKQLYSLRPSKSFRLFLTAEVSPNIPQSLILLSQSFVFEPPSGVKASLLRSLQSVSVEQMNHAPAERSRVYFLLMWFHAVVLERLQYVPIGWSKAHEFSSSDQVCGMKAIDEWIDRTANGRVHVAPEEIPWDALRTVLGQSFYGGRVDNKFDQALLDSFLETLFTAESFNKGFQLCEGLLAPDGTKHADFAAWVEKLSPINPPTWLGLSASAEKIILANRGDRIMKKVSVLQDSSLLEEEESSGSESKLETIISKNIDGAKKFQSEMMRTRQSKADLEKVSLGNLALKVTFSESAPASSEASMFVVDGLKIEGAKVVGNVLVLTEEPTSKLPLAIFSWEKDSEAASSAVPVPLYYDVDRHTLVTTVRIEGSSGTNSTQFLQRGTAIVACDAAILNGPGGEASETAVDYSVLSYNELRSLCKKKGLSAGGKKVELLERLSNAS